MHSMVF